MPSFSIASDVMIESMVVVCIGVVIVVEVVAVVMVVFEISVLMFVEAEVTEASPDINP